MVLEGSIVVQGLSYISLACCCGRGNTRQNVRFSSAVSKATPIIYQQPHTFYYTLPPILLQDESAESALKEG